MPTGAPYTIQPFSVWSRLESRAREVKFTRSLSAEVRDPLWMLTRQWQWGEFTGEDTGSSITSRVHLKNSQITRFKLRNNEVTNETSKNEDGDLTSNFDNTSESYPLEVKVEGRKVHLDFYAGMKIGLRWKKLLNDNVLYKLYLDEEDYQFIDVDKLILDPINVEDQKIFNNVELKKLLRSSKNRVIDGRVLLNEIIAGGGIVAYAKFPGSLNPAEKTIIEGLANDLLEWWKSLYSAAEDDKISAWDTHHMEYQMACTIPEKNENGDPITPTVLVAKEYYNGRLDWHSFDKMIISDTDGLDPDLKSIDGDEINEPIITEEVRTLMSTGIDFPGFPNKRWWEFEDQHINIGDIDANDTDTAKILLTEFAMVYGNEWSIVPYDVPAGSLSEVKSIVVKDVFGINTLVEASGKGAQKNWQRWNMYNLTTIGEPTGEQVIEADNRLFIPPIIQTAQESKPIDQVNFIRDEVANMCWGIESIIPNELGEGIDGYEEARNLVDSLIQDDYSPDNFGPVEKTFAKYILGTTVPENWIPFVPAKIDDSILNRDIVLQRGVMPRIIPGLNLGDFNKNPDVDGLPNSDHVVKPRSILLNEDQENKDSDGNDVSGYFVYEEEVPRAGSIVKRTFQRTRWYNGKTFVWNGMKKTTGRGEGSSGLKFDKLK